MKSGSSLKYTTSNNSPLYSKNEDVGSTSVMRHRSCGRREPRGTVDTEGFVFRKLTIE